MKYIKLLSVGNIRHNAIFLGVILYSLLLSLTAISQIPRQCGHQRIDMDALKKAEAYGISQPKSVVAASPVLIRVYFSHMQK
jgi:hypothetical protein